MDGDRDKALSGLVGTEPSPPRPTRQLRFRQRNRFAVASSKAAQGLNLALPPGNFGSDMQLNSIPGSTLNLVSIPENVAVQSIVLVATMYNAEEQPPMTFDLTTGATATYGKDTITVGTIAPLKPTELVTPYPMNPGQEPSKDAPRWRIDVGYTGDLFAEYGQYQALGSDGKEIHYIDKMGHPVSSVTYLSEQPLSAGSPFPQPTDPKRKYFPANFGRSQRSVTNAFTFVSNIDPASIKQVIVKVNRTLTRKIGPFPVEPK